MSLDGHLELVCDVDAAGRTRLARQSFRAPVHLSKPFWEADALVLNVASPTAGLLDGDRVRTGVAVQKDARMVLTTPAATRLHTMRGGRAEVTQRFTVENGAMLEVFPELLIPQRGTRYAQRTHLEVEAGGELFFFETLAPGRTAAGEAFAYDEICWETDLHEAGKLIARERFHLTPGNGSLAALTRRFPTAYYGSVLAVSPKLTATLPFIGALHDLHCAECWVGVSALEGAGAYAVKMVAADSLSLRKTLRATRRALYEGIGRAAPNLRRAGD